MTGNILHCCICYKISEWLTHCYLLSERIQLKSDDLTSQMCNWWFVGVTMLRSSPVLTSRLTVLSVDCRVICDCCLTAYNCLMFCLLLLCSNHNLLAVRVLPPQHSRTLYWTPCVASCEIDITQMPWNWISPNMDLRVA